MGGRGGRDESRSAQPEITLRIFYTVKILRLSLEVQPVPWCKRGWATQKKREGITRRMSGVILEIKLMQNTRITTPIRIHTTCNTFRIKKLSKSTKI